MLLHRFRIGGVGDFVAPVFSALALMALIVVFAREASSFRRAVIGWAERDLAERAAMVASSLDEPLAIGDFREVQSVADKCSADGLRLTVFSGRGGLVFDSSRIPGKSSEEIYASVMSGEREVRLGIPRSRVLAPFRRARMSFALAAFAGGAGVLLVFFVAYRQRMRIRELARIEKFRRDFIADFSHELKTPLTGIVGAADLLDDNPPPDIQRKLVGMLRAESLRLNALARSILDLARLERSDYMAARSPVDLSELVGAVVQRFERELRERGISLSVQCGGTVNVFGDRQLLEQALSNLVVNAMLHSGSKNIIVGAGARNGKAELYVEDSGLGIPPDQAEHVFERFYRVDQSRGGGTGGSGLGLAIVKRIAQMHGGVAKLDVVRPHGCRFSIQLPF